MIGLLLVTISVALNTENWAVFISLSSIILVLGGTIASTFISYEARYALLSLSGMIRIFRPQKVGRNILNFEVGRLIKWGYIVQQKGPLALEGEVKKIRREDPILGFGIDLVVTGYTGAEVKNIMDNLVEATFERQVVLADILKFMGNSAPAWGMIGTLIGLIIMLGNIGGDPRALGSGLALALITTLYGTLIARVFFIPAANKIRQREEIRRFRNYLVSEGLALLADRKNPRFVQDSMNAFLDPKLHFDIDRQMKSGRKS